MAIQADTSNTVSVEMPEGQALSFGSPDEADTWLTREVASWDWVQREAQKSPPFFPQLRSVMGRFKEVRQAIERWKGGAQYRTDVVDAIRRLREVGMPLTSEPIAQLVFKLRDSGDTTAAAAALASHMGLIKYPPDQEIPFSITRGVAAATLLHARVSPDAPDVIAQALGEIEKALREKLSGATKDVARLQIDAEELLRTSRERFENTETELRKTWTGKIEESIAKIEATDAAYTKQMQLQASVKYWQEQSTEQKSSSQIYLFVLCCFAFVVIFLGWLNLTLYVPRLIEFSLKEQPSVYAVSATLLLLATTITFWIARILVRLYLSAHHLSIDARERVVMVQTFLALLKEGKLDEKERLLVLTPVFRSSADGIVKDEGAPDLSLSALVAKVLDRKPQ